MARSAFIPEFDSDGSSCPVTMDLAASLLDPDPILTMQAADGQATVVTFTPTSNTQIRATESVDSSVVACELDIGLTPAVTNCVFSYSLQVHSINGTVAIQAEGDVDVRSECYTISSFQSTQASYWVFEAVDQA